VLWHRYLGHISQKRMKHLVQNKILVHLDMSDFDPCIQCSKGKQIKVQKFKIRHTTDTFELIHTDICGQLHTCTRNRYTLQLYIFN
jgi:GAG-pre-integrase domain